MKRKPKQMIINHTISIKHRFHMKRSQSIMKEVIKPLLNSLGQWFSDWGPPRLTQRNLNYRNLSGIVCNQSNEK